MSSDYPVWIRLFALWHCTQSNFKFVITDLGLPESNHEIRNSAQVIPVQCIFIGVVIQLDAMRLTYTSNYIADTTLVDDDGRLLYATTTSSLGGKTEVMKFGTISTSTLAILHFRAFHPDTITMNGQVRHVKSYINEPSRWSRSALGMLRGASYSLTMIRSGRAVFTSTDGHTYEWVPQGNSWRLRLPDGTEVGRSHSRSLGLIGSKKHKPYLEFDDDPNISNDLDELVTTFIYVQIKRNKDNEEQ